MLKHLFLFALTFPADIWRAYVICQLWRWFMPASIAAPGYVQVAGLLCLLSLVMNSGYATRSTVEQEKKAEEDKEDGAAMFGRVILGPVFKAAIVLGVGWLWRLAL